MRRASIFVAIIAALFFTSASAHAQTTGSCQGGTYPVASGSKLMCTIDLGGTSGKCKASSDIVTFMKTPWEKVPISIVGVTINVALSNPSGFRYSFAGTSYSPDWMGWAAATPSGAFGQTFYPRGIVFPFPAKGGANPPHIDNHIMCDSGTWQVWQTIWYTIP